MPAIEITEFTDPACPFAWSAEPSRRRLDWLYGDQLQWSLRMVGLAERSEDYAAKGLTPERLSAGMSKLAHAHHMPMDTGPRERVAGTIPACRAVVAARLNVPERERAMLRALRILHFSGEPLDELATLRAAAERAGIGPDDLETWLQETATEEALREDLRVARDPSPGALALDHKLAGAEHGGRRYTCPSYELAAGGPSLSVPGFQPTATYEVAIANLDPSLRRRADPDDVAEVLAWAGEPLATAEVAAVCGIDLDEARQHLGRVATEQHIGFEGIWSLN